MAPDLALPWLTTLVFLPLVGALAVAVLGRTRAALSTGLAIGVSSATTMVAALGLVMEPTLELRTWILSAGVSFHLGSGGQSAVVVLWVALATAIALVATRPAPRTAAVLLGLESASVGLLLAQDMLLMLAFFGGILVALALLASSPRGVLGFGLAALAVLTGWFAHLSNVVYLQTGFPSTDLSRWLALVLYPDEQHSLFIVGTLATAFMVPAFVTAMKDAPRAHRLALFATVGPLGCDFLLRVLMPLCPRGADASSSWVMTIAILLMVSAWLARGWVHMALGYYGLVLFGVFTIGESATDVVGLDAKIMTLVVAIGFYALELIGPHRLQWLCVASLIGMPVVFVLQPVWSSDAMWASVATFAFAIMTFRFLTLARDNASAPSAELEWP